MFFKKMGKFQFRLFCISSLLFLSYAVESDDGMSENRQAYNIHDLLSDSIGNVANSIALKTLSPSSIHDLRFGGGQDFDLETPLDLSLNLSRCSADILHTLMNYKEMWALNMLDSFGKPESGILQGNFKFIGNYKECVKVRSSNPNATVGNFNGKYCSLGFPLSISNFSVPFTFAVCLPDSCSDDDIEAALNLTQIVIGIIPALNGTNLTLTCKPPEGPLNAPSQIVIGLLSIFCFLAVLGSSLTIVDHVKKIITEDSRKSSLIINVSENSIGDPSSPRKSIESDDVSLLRGNESDEKDGLTKLKTFLRCFCIFTNGAKLLNTDSSEGQLLCIHGIRFFSMSWVILGHSYAFLFAETNNLIEAVEELNTFAFQVVLQGFYSVDSFFVLSGFLLTYLSMKEFDKTKGPGSINWPYFYVHRYIRLTPIYMMLLAFSATVFLYMGSGPFWPANDIDANCRETWWWNLLYINNFTSMQKMCMGWSWYLANDMQFFIVSPLFLVALWRWPKVGYGLIAIFLGACFLSNFFITYHFNLSAGLGVMLDSATDMEHAMLKAMNYFDKIYTKPYTRIGPYLIGILVGYLLFKRKTSDKPKHSLAFLFVAWIIASTITLVAVYGLYHKQPGLIASSFYNALHRTTFALGLGWVIYACLVGQGGVVNSILSYKLFIPLSRLTYTAYLIHPMIITGYFSSLKTTFHFSHLSVVLLYFGAMLATYGLSLPVALILESPIVALEKLVRTGFSQKKGS